MASVSLKPLILAVFGVLLITDMVSAQTKGVRERREVDRAGRVPRAADYIQPDITRERRAPEPYVPPPSGLTAPEYGAPPPAIERIPPT